MNIPRCLYIPNQRSSPPKGGLLRLVNKGFYKPPPLGGGLLTFQVKDFLKRRSHTKRKNGRGHVADADTGITVFDIAECLDRDSGSLGHQ